MGSASGPRRVLLAFAMGMAMLAASRAEAGRVVLFPLDAKEVPPDAPREAAQGILRGLTDVDGVQLIESDRVSREFGFDLARQAQECNQDVLCLVQIGQVVEADRLLLGHVKRDPGGGRELRLFVVDVARATLADSLRWDVPARDGALGEASEAAVRQLLTPPDARIVLEITPKDADLLLYGQRVGRKPYGEEMPYWSGIYYGRAQGEGHEPRELRIRIPPGGPTRVAVTLEPDPLWVRSKAKAEAGRRLGSGVSAEVAGALGPVEEGRSAFANPIAWALVGVGIGASVTGGLVMAGAQDDYNAASAELRYTVDQTSPWAEALAVRRDARSQYTLGSEVMLAGVGVGIGGLAWMLIDAALSSGGPPAPVGSVEVGPAQGKLQTRGLGLSYEVGF